MFTLLRNLGASLGISSLQVLSTRNTEIVHSRLVEGLRPDNPVVIQSLPAPFSLTDPSGIAALNAAVSRQAVMVSYIDAFWLLAILSGASLLLLLLLRAPRRAANTPAIHIE